MHLLRTILPWVAGAALPCAWAAGPLVEPHGGEVSFSWPLVQVLAQDPSPVEASRFGEAVDMSGDLLVVGAPQRVVDGFTDAGAAYVYRRLGGTWQLETILTAGDPQTSTFFGYSVSVADAPEREVVVVSEPSRDDGADPDAGRVTIHERVGGSWQDVAQISGGGDYRRLGHSIDTDGASVLIGAPYTNAFHGATVILRRDASGPTWVFDHEIRPDPADEVAGYYGFSVAIAGPYALTGAANAQSVGAAEISNLFTDGPLQQRVVLHAPSPGVLDGFGWSVAASGTVFMVGAPSADESAQIQNSGAVFAYRLDGQVATFEKRLAARYPQQNAYFGTSVAFTGARLAVGEPQRRTLLVVEYPLAGSVSVFSRSAQFGLWNRETTLYNLASNERMGTAVAAAGARVVAGVPQRGSGAAQIHLRDAIFADGFQDGAPE
jgi:hypothetical protein